MPSPAALTRAMNLACGHAWDRSARRSCVGDDAPGSRSPTGLADLHVFVSHVVAEIVLGLPGMPKFIAAKSELPWDGIPADASTRHLVERRHQAGEQIG